MPPTPHSLPLISTFTGIATPIKHPHPLLHWSKQCTSTSRRSSSHSSSPSQPRNLSSPREANATTPIMPLKRHAQPIVPLTLHKGVYYTRDTVRKHHQHLRIGDAPSVSKGECDRRHERYREIQRELGDWMGSLAAGEAEKQMKMARDLIRISVRVWHPFAFRVGWPAYLPTMMLHIFHRRSWILLPGLYFC
jgi:hypothetical protein